MRAELEHGQVVEGVARDENPCLGQVQVTEESTQGLPWPAEYVQVQPSSFTAAVISYE
ncbi:hypothetical protein [Streptomyces sp. NPDC023838]|uniref:hypothetical protein n=1 Tax=Streptomyces sp. NPDC023838 TaxID=3154325 RepID=UPI0033C674B4